MLQFSFFLVHRAEIRIHKMFPCPEHGKTAKIDRHNAMVLQDHNNHHTFRRDFMEEIKNT